MSLETVLRKLYGEDKENIKEPCWDGYEQIGTKIKDGKEVPNCVPIKADRQK